MIKKKITNYSHLIVIRLLNLYFVEKNVRQKCIKFKQTKNYNDFSQ